MMPLASWIAALAAALALSACGDDDDDSTVGDSEEASVCELAEARPGTEVSVPGRSWRLPPSVAGDLGFALADSGCAVLVVADRLDRINANSGDPVEVTGLVGTLDVRGVERLLGRASDGGRTLSIPGAPPLSIRPGVPVLDSFATTGEDRVPSP